MPSRAQLNAEFVASLAAHCAITGATTRSPLLDFQIARRSDPVIRSGDRVKGGGIVIKRRLATATVRWESGEESEELVEQLEKV